MATSRNEGLTTVAIPNTNGILVDLCDALSGAPTLDELHDRWGSSSRRRLGLSRQQWHNPATVDLVDAIAQGRDLTEALRAVGEARAWAGLSLDETLADLDVLAGLVPSSASAEALALRSRASAGWTRCAPHPWWARPGPSPSTAGPSPSSSPRGFDAAVMDPDSDDGRLMAQAYRSLPERWQPPGGLVRVVAVVVQRRHCRPAVSTHAGGLRARREAVADSRRRGAEVLVDPARVRTRPGGGSLEIVAGEQAAGRVRRHLPGTHGVGESGQQARGRQRQHGMPSPVASNGRCAHSNRPG